MAASDKATWIVIADGEKALVVEHEAQNGDISPKNAMNLGDWHSRAVPLFVHDVADLLRRKDRMRAFDRLVLVGCPQMLGLLRRRLPSGVLRRVVAEVDRSPSQHPAHRVERMLHQRLAAAA